MEPHIFESVVVAPSFSQQMIDHALKEFPLECCGVLGGRKNVISSVYPITNELKSPSAFRAGESELFKAVRTMRQNGEDFIGIYHSHPHSFNEPSEADCEENLYPGHFYFIISFPEKKEPLVQCYLIPQNRIVTQIEIV